MTYLIRWLVAFLLIIPGVSAAQKDVVRTPVQAEHCISCHGYQSHFPGRPVPRAFRHTVDWSLEPDDLKAVLAQHPGYHARKFSAEEISHLASGLEALRRKYSRSE